MRTVLAITAVVAFVTPAAAQSWFSDWNYRGDIALPVVDPLGGSGSGSPTIRLSWQNSNWTQAESWGYPYPGNHRFYAPIGYVDSTTLGNILDPSYSASVSSPLSVMAQIRDRSGAIGTVWFNGDLTIN